MPGRRRVVIEGITPQVDCGSFPIKRIVGEEVTVEADVFCDGHDMVTVCLLWREAGETEWRKTPMSPLGNDRWQAAFTPSVEGTAAYTVQAWIDAFRTWRDSLGKKHEAGQDVRSELLAGAEMVLESAARAQGEQRRLMERWAEEIRNEEAAAVAVALATSSELLLLMDLFPDFEKAMQFDRELPVTVERKRALYSTWYEMFPRSTAEKPGKHGTFRDCERLLPEIAQMGFDVLYLPPVHPIGRVNRKGKNNSPTSAAGEPGSPWAIGAEEGGHTALHPGLGTIDDFRRLVKLGEELGVEVALDIAFQCAPDHPYVSDSPEWFRWRPDGTIQYAENPPKKYQDVVPFEFENREWRNLWEELLGVFRFWIGEGVRIFRVDNPHTKPFPLWEWIIGEIRKERTDVIFLAEAFTRPKVMYRLAKLGFTQSYTYFTWRNTSRELREYLTELTRTEVREYFRPNFWPNTPDILHEYLQFGGRPAFVIRLVLAATLSSSYGIYGPAYELCIGEALDGKEEYLDSEKFEVKFWERSAHGNLRDFISLVNRIRREHTAFHTTWNVEFHGSDNKRIIFYSKTSGDDVLLIAVNLDPFGEQSAELDVPLESLGIPEGQPYLVHDLLSEEKYIWEGRKNTIVLDPHRMPAKIMAVRRRLLRENDFDYYM
jgi:starch synthase (maltosyl-transferring)